jgi:outer membrane protein assembly factor BamB
MKRILLMIAVVVAVGCKTTPKGINQTSKVKIGTPIWEFASGGDVDSSPAIGSDGTVYVGSNDKKLYAIKPDSKGLAKSPWPMRGQNAQHTGRVMKKE